MSARQLAGRPDAKGPSTATGPDELAAAAAGQPRHAKGPTARRGGLLRLQRRQPAGPATVPAAAVLVPVSPPLPPALVPVEPRTGPGRHRSPAAPPVDVLQPLAGHLEQLADHVPTRELAAVDVDDLPTVELAAARVSTRPLELAR